MKPGNVAALRVVDLTLELLYYKVTIHTADPTTAPGNIAYPPINGNYCAQLRYNPQCANPQHQGNNAGWVQLDTVRYEDFADEIRNNRKNG